MTTSTYMYMTQLCEISYYLLHLWLNVLLTVGKIVYFSLSEVIHHNNTFQKTNVQGKFILQVYCNVTTSSIHITQT